MALRRLRFTAAEIAETLEMALSTVSGILTRLGLGRLGRIGLERRVRYEHSRPGELVHIDVKRLGRIQDGAGKRMTRRHQAHPDRRRLDAARVERKMIGWEYVHVCVDDYSRLAYAEVLHDERAATAIGFLHRAIRFYARHGITVERVLTDNGSAYVSARHALACKALGIRHSRTRPYRPQTNGKAERFIRTLLQGWAYGAIYRSSTERTRALDGWLWHYNHQRRHSALGHQPPITRTNLLVSTARHLVSPERPPHERVAVDHDHVARRCRFERALHREMLAGRRLRSEGRPGGTSATPHGANPGVQRDPTPGEVADVSCDGHGNPHTLDPRGFSSPGSTLGQWG